MGSNRPDRPFVIVSPEKLAVFGGGGEESDIVGLAEQGDAIQGSQQGKGKLIKETKYKIKSSV